MTDKRRWYTSRWFLALVVVLAAVVFWGWWRMGGVEIEVNEAALASAPASEAAGPVEFSVLTYNVQARPWFDNSKHKFPFISPLLNRFDIVGVQECFKDHGRLWAQADHPVKVYHSELRNPFKIVGSGLGILGRYPLVGTESMTYSDPGDFQNWPASKGILMARFDVNGMPVDVYNTHIAAGKKKDTYRAKSVQGDELIAFVKEHSPPDHNVIFVADFNMRPSRGPEDKEENKDNPKVFVFDRIMESLQFRDVSDEVNGPTLTNIDRVLFRPGAGYTMEALTWQKDGPEFYDPAKEPLSDHEPVFVSFRLSRKGEATVAAAAEG
jgi:endonuclease/exonuclease/phosphatase family metal-dependent hydrolase